MYVRTYALTRTCAVYLVGGGLIIEANIPEGRGLIFRIRYIH